MMQKLFFTFVLLTHVALLKAEGVVVLDGESGMIEAKSNELTPVEIPNQTENSQDGKLILSDESQLGGKTTPPPEPVVVPPVLESEQVKTEEIKVDEVKNDDYQTSEIKSEPPKTETVKSENVKPDIFPKEPKPSLIDSMANHPFYNERFLRTFIHVYSGRLNTNLKKVSPTLSKGVDLFGFGVANTINENWQGIMALEIGQKKNEKNTSKNVVLYQLKVGGEYAKSLTDSQKIKLLVHTALTLGDFNLRSTNNETQNTVTQNKYGEGTLIGLHPGLGLRFPVGNFFHLDALLTRPIYLGKDRKNLGGFQYLARFALPW